MFEIRLDEYKAPYNAVPIGHQGENLARCVIWDLTPCVSEFGDGTFAVKVTRPGGDTYWALHTDRVLNNAMWVIDNVDTAEEGTGMVEFYFNAPDGTTLAKSDVFKTWCLPTLEYEGDPPDPYESMIDAVEGYAATASDAASSATASATAAAASAEEASVRYGSPLTANHVSDMTDHSRVYIYTGHAAGYNNGHWYYWDGTAWTDGGVYNSEGYNTDETLSVQGMAADAKAVGDMFSQLFSVSGTTLVINTNIGG